MTDASTPERPAAPWLRRLVLVEPGELAALAWSALMIFLVFASYNIMRPVREAFGVERGADDLPSLITATLIVMVLATPVYGWLVSRLPRRRFVTLVYRFFVVNLLAFFLVFRAAPDDWKLWLGYGFYVWLSVFNLFVVSVFWALMADLWSSTQAKRLFGAIGVGATLGVIAGSAFTTFMVEHVGRLWLLLIAGAILEASVWCIRPITRSPGPAGAGPGGPARSADPEPAPGALAGLRYALRSPYLIAISGYMLCYTMCSTFLYLKVGDAVSATIADRDARAAFYASITLWTNILTLVTQVFLTARLVRWVGVGIALTAVPIVTIAGFIVLGRSDDWGLPILGTVFAFNVARNWTNYAVSRPSREMLFSVLPREAKYKAKPFIDTFVYRSGDALGAWSPKWLAKVLVPLWAGAVAIGAIGLALGLVLGAMRSRRESAPNAS